jgi:hypothetical protein
MSAVASYVGGILTGVTISIWYSAYAKERNDAITREHALETERRADIKRRRLYRELSSHSNQTLDESS